MKIRFLYLFTLLITFVSLGFSKNVCNQPNQAEEGSLSFIQIKNDAIFNSNQIISLLTLNKKDSSHFTIKFAHSQSDLNTTSSLALSNDAVAAVNGGFFNMIKGGSLTYFEMNDTVINKTDNTQKKKSISAMLMNGAIVVEDDFKTTIQRAKSEEFYELSKQESAVLITGPLLLSNSVILQLPDTKFVNKRHPRTCLCETKDALLFITVDGRRKEAVGMSLLELQSYLLTLDCINAINLDGGGSTTMWIKDKGVVNFPSDDSEERPVANALLITKKEIDDD